MTYRIIDCPVDGSTGQDCGDFTFAELPERIRAAILAAPEAGKWSLPALSEGDGGEELDELRTVVTLS